MLTSNDYGVRVIRAYETRRVGQVFFPPGLLRDALVRGGFVERVKAPEVAQPADELPLQKRAPMALKKR